MIRLLDLFSGIGGFSLAAEWVWGRELEIVYFVEINKFCQKVLGKHWPKVPIHNDIKTFKYSGPVDIVTGGFPCQPFSTAGKRRGTKDDRYLWPEMLRIVRDVHPRYVVVENVPGLDDKRHLALERTLSDLEAEGYQLAPPFQIPANAVKAPHERYRLWIVAHDTIARDGQLPVQPRESLKADINPDRRGEVGGDAKRLRLQGHDGREPKSITPHGRQDVADPTKCGLRKRRTEAQRGQSDPEGSGSFPHDDRSIVENIQRLSAQKGLVRRRQSCSSNWWHTEPALGRVAYGVPHRVDRLKALGNAIVPQIAYEIFQAIKEHDARPSTNI